MHHQIVDLQEQVSFERANAGMAAADWKHKAMTSSSAMLESSTDESTKEALGLLQKVLTSIETVHTNLEKARYEGGLQMVERTNEKRSARPNGQSAGRNGKPHDLDWGSVESLKEPLERNVGSGSAGRG